MGKIATSSIYLKSELTAFDSSKISNALKSICTSVMESRKGRHWEITFGRNEPGLFTVDVHKTETYLWEVEEEMAEMGITTSEFPEVIVIVSNVGRMVDQRHCQMISDRISAEFDCISTKAELKS